MKTLKYLIPILALTAGILTPKAATADPADYTYTVNGGEATITGYTGPGGDVIIPDTLGGYPVTILGDWSFYYKTSLASVTIPDNVITIGRFAFYYCTGQTNVTIGTGVTTIGDVAFASCTSLKNFNVDLANPSFSSLNGVLFNKDQTTLIQYPIGNLDSSYTIPGSVTTIGEWGFSDCISLTNVTIGNSVTSIRDRAFYNCRSLSSVTIPDSVVIIGAFSFYNCRSLADITIGNSVTNIVGDQVFFNCTALASITVDPSNPSYSSLDGVLFNKNQTDLIQCPGARTGNYTIPGTVATIRPFSFSNCKILTSVTIPDSVTSIGDSAFYNCLSLAGVTIPDSVTTIGTEAFNYCTSLPDITIGNSVATIGVSAFRNCSSLTSVTIPDTVTTIRESTFYGCTSLASVTIPGNVTIIENSAFYNCVDLVNITIPGNVTTIGYRAFYNCTSLNRLVIPSSVTTIDTYAFERCTSLAHVYFCGIPPTPGSSVFDNTPATLYYLPAHAAQWPETYAGRPTALWNPTFTVPELAAGAFSSSVTGTPGIPVAVEARASLLTGQWTRIQTTNLPPSGILEFTDPDADHPSRFYRITGP